MNKSYSRPAVLILFVVVAVISYLYFSGQGLRTQVRLFKECVDAGYSANTESYPAYCITPAGKRFYVFIDRDGWKTYEDAEEGLVYKHPESLGLKYIEEISWPPEATVEERAFNCLESEGGDSRTEIRNIDGRNYCVTQSAEELENGSIDAEYFYATELAGAEGDYFVQLSFKIRTPNCQNLEGLEVEECQTEFASLDLDGLMNRMMRTVWINRQAGEREPDSSFVTIRGSFACLVPRDTEGPVNDICLLGLLGDDGNYYSLTETEGDSENLVLWRFSDGDRIVVEGSFQPRDHETYQRIGVIKVETVRPLGDN